MNGRRVGPDPLDRGRFPIDPWRAGRDRATAPDDLGVTETLFTVANGYLGMRGNPEEGRDAYAHGTFVNGFHETWPIRHAEAAFGFARTGQTHRQRPRRQGDEALRRRRAARPSAPPTSSTTSARLDFRDGVLRRSLVWRTPSGKRVRVDSTRMVSMTQRHLAVHDPRGRRCSTGDAPIVISSQLLNRQDGKDEYHDADGGRWARASTRARPARFDERVLLPRMHYATRGPDAARLPVRQLADDDRGRGRPLHRDRATSTRRSCASDEDLAKMVFRVEATEGSTIRLEKPVAYHSSRGVPVRELSDRCDRTLDRAARHGVAHYHRRAARRGTTTSGTPADVEVGGDDAERPSASSRRSASTCSASPRPPPAPTGRACPPRA